MELFTLGLIWARHVSSGRDEPARRSVLRKRYSRAQLLPLYRELKVELIGMEACGGSHFWGERCESKGMRCV